jgi:uncharacterized coiled-coil DUF342 family protein
MEKTAAELFNEATEYRKKSDEASDKIDEIKREINKHRNELDEFTKNKRIAIRNLEDEEMSWKKVLRSNRTLAEEKERQAWQVRNSGV